MEIEFIHEDKRGKILRFLYKGEEFILLITRKGYSRGGDYHETRQHDVVLDGSIEWRETFDGMEATKVVEAGEAISVEAGIPHMLTALEDSLVLEWLEGSFEKKYFAPYRDLIKRKMK